MLKVVIDSINNWHPTWFFYRNETGYRLYRGKKPSIKFREQDFTIAVDYLELVEITGDDHFLKYGTIWALKDNWKG